jgi:hypothetical protein
MMIAVDSELSLRRIQLSEVEPWYNQQAELSGSNLSCYPDWILGAWQNFHRYQRGVDPERGLYLMQASTPDQQIVGVSAWFRQVLHGIRWWKLCGSGQVCSDYVRNPCLEGAEEQMGHSLAIAMNQAVRGGFGLPQVVEIEGHTADCPQWRTFFSRMAEFGWSQQTVEIEGAWRAQLPSDWETYDALLSKSRRRKVRRALKLIDQKEIEYSVYRSTSEIEQAWPIFVRLHQLRRKQLGQAGCFADNHFETFLTEATQQLADLDVTWLAILSNQGQPMAGLLLFDCGTTSYMYQSGMDCQFIEMEPGHLIVGATIAHAMKNGQLVFDFMRGDEHYKSGWQAERLPLFRTRLTPPGLAGRSLASAFSIRQHLRSWLA